jgi:hypothetical protein
LGRISNSHLLSWETLVTAQLGADSADIDSSCQEENNCQVKRTVKMSESRPGRRGRGDSFPRVRRKSLSRKVPCENPLLPSECRLIRDFLFRFLADR